MSADKRTVSTDALETLGKIIGQNEKRDAIHLAVLPVKAIYTLEPRHVDHVPVQPGQRFWMILRPRLITSLRHVWTHPALPDESAPDANVRERSEQWLRNFCDDGERPSYELLIEALCEEVFDSDYSFHIEGQEASGEIPPEFWDHAEIVTGRRFTVRPTYFTCGC